MKKKQKPKSRSRDDRLTEVGEGVCLGHGSDAASQGAVGALRTAHAHTPARPKRHVHARPCAGTLVHPHAWNLPSPEKTDTEIMCMSGVG